MSIEVATAAFDRAWEDAMPYLKSHVPVVILSQLQEKLDDYRIAVEQELMMADLRAQSAEEEAMALAIVAGEVSERKGGSCCG